MDPVSAVNELISQRDTALADVRRLSKESDRRKSESDGFKVELLRRDGRIKQLESELAKSEAARTQQNELNRKTQEKLNEANTEIDCLRGQLVELRERIRAGGAGWPGGDKSKEYILL